MVQDHCCLSPSSLSEAKGRLSETTENKCSLRESSGCFDSQEVIDLLMLQLKSSGLRYQLSTS